MPNQKSIKPHKVFVYGTLKRGKGNHFFLKNSDFLGPVSSTDKFAMYKTVEAFPYVVEEQSDDGINGELYAIDDTTLAMLDFLEGHPNFYHRVKTHLNDGTECFIYVVDKKLLNNYETKTKIYEF